MSPGLERQASLLAPGAGRRSRWVLKPLGRRSGSLRPLLRPDMLDLSSLSHPALVLPEAFGRDRTSGEAFLLRPRVAGLDLLAAARGRSPREVLPWLAAAADALGILHRHGFLHRNLKASNILVTRDALLLRPRHGIRVVLSDPAWWPEAEDAARSEAAPPEVRQGEAPSPASDLHALGAVIRKLGQAAGEEAPGFGATRRRDAGIEVDLERVAARLLQPEPARRYQSAAALGEDLRRLAGRRAPPALPPADCLLGRKEEIEGAATRLEAALGGAPAVLLLKGPAGIGKSVLLRRIVLEAQVLGHRTVAARWYPERSEEPALIHAIIEELTTVHPRRRKVRDSCRAVLAASAAPEGRIAAEDSHRRLVRGLAHLLVEAAGEGPVLIAIDDAHFADALTIEVLSESVRSPGGARGGPPPGGRPPSIAISCRTEGRLETALRPLEAALEDGAARRHAVTLGPLHTEAIEDLLGCAGVGDEERRAALSARLGGHPLSLREAIRRGERAEREDPGRRTEVPAGLEKRLHAIAPEARRILDVLSVLGRPAPPALLAGVLRAPAPRIRHSLDALVENGTLAREAGAYFFRHWSHGVRLRKRLARRARMALHRMIALVLERGSPDAAEEIARHWLESDAPARGARHAITAARRLARGHDPRSAVSFYEAAVARVPRREKGLRRALLEESAEALSRVGEHRRAASIALRLVRESRRRSDVGRLHHRAGSYFHRAGSMEEAAAELEKCIRALSAGKGRADLRERLRAWSELAEIRSNQGDYARAETLAREALKRAGATRSGARDPEIRREEMVLLETLAHLHLRRFRYREARDLFERSLEAGRLIGAAAEQSLILNNLGTLHIQENRFREALSCYERAASLSAGLGDDQSLSIIHSNLAILHARLGDHDPADASLARAKEHDTRGPSARSRYVRLHAAGLVDLALGRYAAAVDSLQEAIRTGEEIEDLHMVAFDFVFLGEARLLRGELKAAGAAFDRALSAAPSPPPPVPPMVAARRSLVCALRGDRRGAARALGADRAAEASVPYVEAWNRLFRGWALRLLGRSADAGGELRPALDFFARAEVPAGEVHAGLELAAAEIDGGRAAAAAKRIAALRRKHVPGRGPLRNAMLSARLLAYEARAALAQGPRAAGEVESLLVDAEGQLIGRGIRDLEALVSGLRAAVRELRPAQTPVGSPPGTSATGAAGSSDPAPAGARAILGCSGAIRRLVAAVLEAAPSILPVLITGETGSGKDAVARAIHEESPRRAALLVSVNCAAIPRELLEDQLFGHARGAFTGADDDRPGLLAAATGGTFLFDEVGDLPLDVQARLLRALAERRVRPLGAGEEVALDVRFLFATSRDLPAMVDAGSFRRDLFYRIRVLEVRVPPLRERPEDIPILVDRFREAAAGRAAPAFDEGALRALAEHSWPGNVRELQNVVTRLAVSGADRSITESEIRAALDGGGPARLFPPALLRSRSLERLQADLEREYLADLHARHEGDLEAMATELRISTRALYDRFRKLGIRPRDLRGPPA